MDDKKTECTNFEDQNNAAMLNEQNITLPPGCRVVHDSIEMEIPDSSADNIKLIRQLIESDAVQEGALPFPWQNAGDLDWGEDLDPWTWSNIKKQVQRMKRLAAETDRPVISDFQNGSSIELRSLAKRTNFGMRPGEPGKFIELDKPPELTMAAFRQMSVPLPADMLQGGFSQAYSESVAALYEAFIRRGAAQSAEDRDEAAIQRIAEETEE